MPTALTFLTFLTEQAAHRWLYENGYSRNIGNTTWPFVYGLCEARVRFEPEWRRYRVIERA